MTTALAGDGDGGGASSPPQASASASKGKAKMDDETAAEAWTCGICLAKPREPIRGELDCCAHHFCFVCIMGWARVESRCPFCKARFRTIRRPPVPGLLPSERIVAVPERNQVYRPEGNASSTMGVDPYANTICSVCNCGENDELLILCDLCDSAAHSYCAGLGTVVPEEDWFCDDCAVCKEHSRCQVEDEDTNLGSGTTVQSSRVSGSRTPVQSSRVSMDYPVPSIYDIVGDDYTTDAGSIRLPSNSENAGSQSPKSTREQDNGLASYHALIRKEIEKNRAFRNSRNRDKRIRALRESWASLREGSLGFGTHVPCRRTQGEGETTSGIPKYQRFAAPTVDCSKNGVSGPSGSSDLLSLAPFSEEASTSLSHGNKISHKDTRDVRKAWKMLQMAKSSGERKASKKLSSLNSSSPFSMGNRSTSYSPIDTILGLKNQNLNKATQKNSAKCDHGTKMDSAPTTENSRKCRSLPGSSRSSAHERDISFHDQINEESLNGEVAASKNHHFVGKKLEPLCGTDRSEKVKSDTPRPVKCSLSSGQSTVTSSLQVGPSAGSQSNVMVNPEDSSAVCVATTDENRSSATIEVRKCSGSDHHERKRKLSSEKRHDQTSKRSRSSCKSAKTEISSLAIRELKLLKIDKTYGSDRFKEVARTVTHTVLAACEFEHSPSQSLAISKPVCEHSSAVKPSKSSVIADSCAECLRDFVKEAIGLVLSGSQMDKTVQT